MSDYIPPTVITSILSRLPVKTLVRFRCVCKSWCSLISSPNFINKHLTLTLNNPPHLLLKYLSLSPKREHYSLRLTNESIDEFTQLHCPFKTASGNFFRVIGSCNGLICLSDECFGFTYTIIIWNPAIKKYVSLPMPRVCFDSYGPYTFSLGFGFDPGTMDYKVVRIAYVFDGDHKYMLPPEVEVYAFSTGEWRTVSANHVTCKIVEFFWSSAFVNGAVHWVAYNRDEDGQFSNRVLVFDMGSELFRQIELPNQLVHDYPMDLTVSAFGDTVVVFLYQGRMTGQFCDGCAVWVMGEYGNVGSWSKRFFVELDGGISNVLGFGNSGELLLEKCIGRLVSYMPESDEIKNLGIRGFKDSFYVGNYVESLVLMDAEKGVLGDQVKFVDGADSEDEPDLTEMEQVLEELHIFRRWVAHRIFAKVALEY
ncbi:hypothetical protein LguiB_002194 [Lonicera macranthoides]